MRIDGVMAESTCDVIMMLPKFVRRLCTRGLTWAEVSYANIKQKCNDFFLENGHVYVSAHADVVTLQSTV